MSSRTFTVDTKGLFFAAQIIALVAVIASAWYAFLPIRDHIVRKVEGASVEQGGIGSSSIMDDETREATIERLLSRADEDNSIFGSDKVARTFHYVPEDGKFMSVDLVTNEVVLYEDGARKAVIAIQETPTSETAGALREGDYVTGASTELQVSALTLTHFPFYVPFGSAYAFHGEPTDGQGVPKEDTSAGAALILNNADAKKVFDFAVEGTPLHVRARPETPPYAAYTSLVARTGSIPATSARSYAISDLARGQIVLEKNAGKARPIASITKLFTALVASQTIGHGTQVQAPNGEVYTLGDLFYPLLLRSDNAVAARIAEHAGSAAFIGAMNKYAKNLGMPTTSFADASGLSPRNVSSAFDLTSFARHLYLDKRYILDISREGSVSITSTAGTAWGMQNQNKLAGDPHFVGGKLGFTDEAGQTALSIFTVPIDGETRTIAIVILGSSDWKQDTRTLLRWLLTNVDVEK